MDRMYSAIPGRANTYFNNPYMGQIADNLSSAIYGDPRDELVREQIKNQRHTRERQLAADAQAQAEREREEQAITGLAASLMEANALPSEERNPALIGALADNMRATGKMSDMLLPLLLNQQHQGEVAMQDDRQAADIRLTGVEHALGLERDVLGYAWDITGDQLNNDADTERALLGHIWDYSDNRAGDEAALQRTIGTQAGGFLRGLAGQGLSDTGLAESLFPNYQADIQPLTDAASRIRALGSGSSGGGMREVTGSDIDNIEDVIFKMVGADAYGAMDINARSALVSEVLKVLGDNGNIPAAVGQVMGSKDFSYTDDNNALWGFGEPETTVSPKGGSTSSTQVWTYDKHGNRIN